MENTKEFVDKIKKITVPEGYVMVSFDVVSLFTNIPLDQTIEIILRKVYDEKKIKTKIAKENRSYYTYVQKEYHLSSMETCILKWMAL